MTDKICKKCGNYQECGNFCEECGTQLYPDIGFTNWKIPEGSIEKTTKPQFNKWSGRHV